MVSLARFLDRSFPGLSPRRLAGLRWMFMDALTSSVSGSFYEDYFVLFLLAAGVAEGRIGLVVGAGGLASVLAFLPGAFIASRLRVRKPFIMITSGGIARLAIFGLAFLPTLAHGGAGIFWAILGLRFTTALMGSVATPAGTTLTADVVPPAIRGRYFAARMAATSIVAAVATTAAGWSIRLLNGGVVDGVMGFRFSFAVAFVGGMIATACFSRIPEPPVRRTARAPRARDVLSIARRSPAFLWLAVSAALWSLAVSTASPFFNVYLVTRLGGNAAVVGVGAAVSALTGLGGYYLFGRLADRRGNRLVLMITGFLLPILPGVWAFITNPWQVCFLNIPSGLIWAGYNLASFNLLLEMCPPEDREAGVAVYQTLVAITTIGGPVLGGWLASRIGYVPMFAVTGAGRLASMVLFVALARPRPAR
jgi:MFS family permease